MRGTIVSDETWIGGNPKWRHRSEKPDRGSGMRLPTEKTPVLSLIDAERGEVRSRVVPDVTGPTLRKVMSEQVDMAGSVLWTDEGSWYKQLGARVPCARDGQPRRRGVRGCRWATTNRAEGYFAQLKRSIDGTHHHVSREHLPRYLAEFDFRYNTCKMSDEARMRLLAGQMEGRLTLRRAVTSHS